MTKRCNECANTVSDAYFRVFSADDGKLHACRQCAHERHSRANTEPHNPHYDGYETGL